MDEATAHRARRTRFLVVLLGLVIVGVAGYVGFRAFVAAERSAVTGVMVLAAGTGFAAFFSPCSFPLLLTFLARRSHEDGRAALGSALRVALGAAALLAILAGGVAVAGSALSNVAAFDSVAGRVFRFGVGVLLIGFGLRQARLWSVRIHWLDRVADLAARVVESAPGSSPARRDVAYGFGYLLAGFG